MTALTDLSIAEAHRLLMQGDVSSADLTRETLAQIERTEPYVHAYATVMADDALAAARAADEDIRAGRLHGPLHGIPVGVKDICYTRGVLTEAGSESMKGFTPSFDAAVVERLRGGGAVIVGKTVTSEFAFGPQLIPTRNAWNQEMVPSGSSAGSGVAVAVRSAFAAIGTDTAGSLRGPAGVNGVVTLKPTFGLVSTHGVIPMAPSLDHVGPITRTVADCAAVLSVIAGFDPRDPNSLRADVPRFEVAGTDRLEGIRIGVERTHLPDPARDPAAMVAAEEALATLAELGATIVEVAIPELELTDAALLGIKSAETAAYHLDRLRRAGAQYAPKTRVMIQAGVLAPGVDYVRAQHARTIVRRGVRETFQRHRLDALVGPGWGPPTGAADGPGLPFTYPLRASAVNLTGMPTLNVPCGFGEDGLPLGGFELWGRPLGESMILRIAYAYEQVHRWHTRRPPVAEATAAV